VNRQQPHGHFFITWNSILSLLPVNKYIILHGNPIYCCSQISLCYEQHKTLTWKHFNIGQLIKKISATCYALRHVKYSLSTETLKIIYFAHIHTIRNYGVVFWVNSSYAKKVFILQKKIIRIITNPRPRDSCREIFRNMWIMTLYSHYKYSLLSFTVDNKHLFTANNQIHKHDTRNNNNLHPALANLTKNNKGPYISGIHPPPTIFKSFSS